MRHAAIAWVFARRNTGLAANHDGIDFFNRHSRPLVDPTICVINDSKYSHKRFLFHKDIPHLMFHAVNGLATAPGSSGGAIF